ncbi:UTP--glucose-1-phosphate uridylyltransferase [Anaerotruncus sp. AF02-27]|uniref:UTP--glucose-1-phosphate uridylyltransferase GalU n=1 Tax=Anaerotruncus sp. AF02-27 TaxID=2292191 RepID=UPI000E549F46|nr:UTP--glucose-1-phosphate uridylyltransferase GalU [Anaerotruncus sp. AF02-27]RGX54641.1 UTP--glucose-1-phosphate uridylyltransferase [Anaerotruncus sp. AF02-27]
MKVRKAVIPAAGLGTRVLPASKAVPKEMLPIVDKPAIQYIVEEAVASGIEDILIITNRGKSLIEDHFDHAPELEEKLLSSGKQDLYDTVVSLAHLANIQYVRQKETRGLGHAVWCAKSFVGSEPFAVLYGDDVIISEKPAIGQLMAVNEQYGKSVVGIKPVAAELLPSYCTLDVKQVQDRVYQVFDMIEKPLPSEILSNFAILGRCVLTPDIFELIEQTPPSRNGEIQLTDAMRAFAKRGDMMGVEYEGVRYDIGNKLGILQAIVEVGLAHPEIGDGFREYLKSISKSL